MSQSTWMDQASEGVEASRCPPGCVLTVLRGHAVIVWLIGDVDASVASDLDDIARYTPDVASRLVIDASRVTFCDSIVLRFIATVAAAVPVTIRRPSRLFADILAVSGLSENPWIQREPGATQ
jgi:anti-anti-sigma regulatory factor